jgi:hypothetical protein
MSASCFVLALAIGAVSAEGIEWRGWGPRAGISSDPDQFVGGVHFDLGHFAENVRFQPSVELGLGDNTTTILGNLFVAYYFPVEAKVTPYAGGSLSVAFYDFDADCRGFGGAVGNSGRCDDSETEIGPVGVGGIEMSLSGKTRFFAELHLGFGDLPEAKVVTGWTF